MGRVVILACKWAGWLYWHVNGQGGYTGMLMGRVVILAC